jgi:hypothetical protein
LFKVIDMNPNDVGYMLQFAKLGVGFAADFQDTHMPGDDVTPAGCEKVMNALFLAWAALGEMIGIPCEEVFDNDDLAGGAA